MPNMSPPHGIFDRAASPTLSLTQGLLLGGVIVIVLSLIIFGVIAWRRSRANHRAVPTNPWSELRRQLTPTLGQTVVERMQVLNFTLRKSLELRSGQPYTAWTSREILAHWQRTGEFSSDFQAQCGEFLKTADRVLFAHEMWDDEVRDRNERQISQWLDTIQSGSPL